MTTKQAERRKQIPQLEQWLREAMNDAETKSGAAYARWAAFTDKEAPFAHSIKLLSNAHADAANEYRRHLFNLFGVAE